MAARKAKVSAAEELPLPLAPGAVSQPRIDKPVFGNIATESGSAAVSDTSAKAIKGRTEAERRFLDNPSPEAAARAERGGTWIVEECYTAGNLPPMFYNTEMGAYFLLSIQEALYQVKQSRGWTEWDTVLTRANDLLQWCVPDRKDFIGIDAGENLKAAVKGAKERRGELIAILRAACAKAWDAKKAAEKQEAEN